MPTPERQSAFQAIVSSIEYDIDACEVDIAFDDEAVARFLESNQDGAGPSD